MSYNVSQQRKAAPAMFYAAPKPSRSWAVIAAEITQHSHPTDPTQLLKLVEELNRAMAKQGDGRATSASSKTSPKTAWDSLDSPMADRKTVYLRNRQS
jgi:hypothetical protein